MLDAHLDKKKAWDRAIKADPEWRSFVEKKRAEEKNTSKNANPVFQGGELGFFSMPAESSPEHQRDSLETKANSAIQGGELSFFLAKIPPINDAFEIQKPAKIDHEHSAINHEHSAINHEHSAIDHDHSMINHDHSIFHQTRYDLIRDR
ncbi:hypothetical protein PENNAL_c0444G02897, partial [Penicillium nalgiovense]